MFRSSKLDSIRPFSPGVKIYAASLACLLVIAAALMVNVCVAFALIVTLASCLIKLYKLDPEPITLLLLHAAISTSMLLDPTTTLAIITVVVAAVVALSAFDLPAEKVAVCLLSVTSSAVLGKVTAAIACTIIAAVIVVLKLRPFQPQSLSLLALGWLALCILINKVFGTLLIVVYIAVVTGLFVLNRMRKNQFLDGSDLPSAPRNNNAAPNGYLPLSNPIESLDLHGHSVTAAMKVLNTYLREREEDYKKNRARHLRHVTIITGDNNNSNTHDAATLVRPTVVNYLKINKYKYEVSSESPGLIKVDLESHAL